MNNSRVRSDLTQSLSQINYGWSFLKMCILSFIKYLLSTYLRSYTFNDDFLTLYSNWNNQCQENDNIPRVRVGSIPMVVQEIPLLDFTNVYSFTHTHEIVSIIYFVLWSQKWGVGLLHKWLFQRHTTSKWWSCEQSTSSVWALNHHAALACYSYIQKGIHGNFYWNGRS